MRTQNRELRDAVRLVRDPVEEIRSARLRLVDAGLLRPSGGADALRLDEATRHRPPGMAVGQTEVTALRRDRRPDEALTLRDEVDAVKVHELDRDLLCKTRPDNRKRTGNGAARRFVPWCK